MPADAENPPVVFCTATGRIIDYVRKGEEPAAAIARLAEYGTSLTVLPVAIAWQRHQDAFKTEPVEISPADFDYALNVLPPVRWIKDGHGESFKMSERLTGAITAIYVQLSGRCFTFNDDIRTPHEECCERVRTSKAYTDQGHAPGRVDEGRGD